MLTGAATMHRTSLMTKNYPIQNVNTAKLEKS
jgi:hypothetical protein